MKRFFLSILLSIMSMIYIEMVFAQPPSSNKLSYFMIAQVPDTQAFFYASNIIHCKNTDSSQLVDMYNWIFDHHDANCLPDEKNGRGCYQYIFHVGDIIDGDDGDNVMWPAAKKIFQQIAAQNEDKIPFGFATGNHDYRSKGPGKDPGQGIYQPGNYDNAKDFLTTIYKEQPDYGPLLINDSPFLSYNRFTIGNVKFIALNVPLGLQGIKSEFDATKNFIANNSDSLIIINSHTFNGWGSTPGNLVDLYKNYKNVFMVLWGHDPANVNSDGGFGKIPGTTISRTNMKDAYQYRFDYQENAPYDCSYKANMPQHPLIRIYSFTLDETNKKLSWKAYDVQAWNPQNSVYSDGSWNGARSRIKLADTDVNLLNDKVMEINIFDYITPKAATIKASDKNGRKLSENFQ